MKKSADSDAMRSYYDNFPWQVALSTTDSGIKICSVTTGSDSETTEAQARNAAITVFGPRPAALETIEDGFYWNQSVNGRDYMIMFQKQVFTNDGKPTTVVSYGLSWN